MGQGVIQSLLAVAKGHTPPDVVIRNGRLINVFTNSIDDNRIILIKGGYIASILSDEHRVFDTSIVIDAEGMYLSPGFIDAHTHLDSMYLFSELVPYALRGGTTGLVTECAMVACSCGIDGVLSFIRSTQGYPVRCFFLAPPLTPPLPRMEGCRGITFKDFSHLLQREDFVGIGEAYWTRVVEGDDRVLKQAALALSLRKRLDGHSAGARGSKLIEYLVTGITSCHESISAEEALEKLRLGLYVMIRQGFVRKELAELSGLKDMNVDIRRVMLVSDSFDSVLLCEEGYMDSVVRDAISYGFSPIEAIKMVTINPADYYGLRYLGAIAPMRYADILFLRDLESISIEKVMVNGTMVYADGHMMKDLPKSTYNKRMTRTLRIGSVSKNDFRVQASFSDVKVRVIEIANQTITREKIHTLLVREGFVEKNLEEDIVPIAVIHRGEKKRFGKGFIKGTGIRRGAIATTLIWDTGNILVIGSDEQDMAVAVGRLMEVQGGIVIAQKGAIIYEFPMPLYGLISLSPMEKIRDKTKELEEKIKSIGSSLERPFLTMQTIPFTGLPFLRITDRGLVDIKNKVRVPLIVD